MRQIYFACLHRRCCFVVAVGYGVVVTDSECEVGSRHLASERVVSDTTQIVTFMASLR